MKQIFKKLFTFVLALTVVCTAVPPVTAKAAVNYPKSLTFYCDYKGQKESFDMFDVDGLTSKQTIKKSTVKSSNPKVAKIDYIERYHEITSSGTEYFDDSKATSSGSEEHGYSFGLTFKKNGTSNITYKVGSKKYTTKVTRKAYTNPVKTVNIAGIKSGGSTNLAKLLDKKYYAELKLNSNKKNATIKVVAKQGWKINYIWGYNNSNGNVYGFNNYGEKGAGSAKLDLGTLKKDGTASIRIQLVNTKDKGTFLIEYGINMIPYGQ